MPKCETLFEFDLRLNGPDDPIECGLGGLIFGCPFYCPIWSPVQRLENSDFVCPTFARERRGERRVVMDQRPNPCFDIARASFDGIQFIFLLKVAGDLVEALKASHGHFVLLARDSETPIGIPTQRRAKDEKIL